MRPERPEPSGRASLGVQSCGSIPVSEAPSGASGPFEPASVGVAHRPRRTVRCGRLQRGVARIPGVGVTAEADAPVSATTPSDIVDVPGGHPGDFASWSAASSWPSLAVRRRRGVRRWTANPVLPSGPHEAASLPALPPLSVPPSSSRPNARSRRRREGVAGSASAASSASCARSSWPECRQSRQSCRCSRPRRAGGTSSSVASSRTPAASWVPAAMATRTIRLARRCVMGSGRLARTRAWKALRGPSLCQRRRTVRRCASTSRAEIPRRSGREGVRECGPPSCPRPLVHARIRSHSGRRLYTFGAPTSGRVQGPDGGVTPSARKTRPRSLGTGDSRRSGLPRVGWRQEQSLGVEEATPGGFSGDQPLSPVAEHPRRSAPAGR